MNWGPFLYCRLHVCIPRGTGHVSYPPLAMLVWQHSKKCVNGTSVSSAQCRDETLGVDRDVKSKETNKHINKIDDIYSFNLKYTNLLKVDSKMGICTLGRSSDVKRFTFVSMRSRSWCL